jgi:hypothetical protein
VLLNDEKLALQSTVLPKTRHAARALCGVTISSANALVNADAESIAARRRLPLALAATSPSSIDPAPRFS